MKKTKEIHWSKLTYQHQDDRECLACFFAWQTAEIMSDVKPANLINIMNRTLDCGRNMLNLWQRHGQSMLDSSAMRALKLVERDERHLMLLYSPEKLYPILQQPEVIATLESIGYPVSDCESILSHLQKRMQQQDFPHEIGFFIGYPVKDVLGYMGLSPLPLVGQGPWKMYGELESSRSLAQAHVTARRRIQACLKTEKSPLTLLKKKRPALQRAA